MGVRLGSLHGADPPPPPLPRHEGLAVSLAWQVLLGCAVLVCLGGVMYESDRFKSNEFSSQKNLITVLLVIVIIFSVLYCA
jgi:hypothetical protein